MCLNPVSLEWLSAWATILPDVFGIKKAAACAAYKVPGTRPEDMKWIEAGH
jgi:hypothetical protein